MKQIRYKRVTFSKPIKEGETGQVTLSYMKKIKNWSKVAKLNLWIRLREQTSISLQDSKPLKNATDYINDYAYGKREV